MTIAQRYLVASLLLAHAAETFQPTTKADLQTAVNLYVSNPTSSDSTYGDIAFWDTSLITDMSSLFYNKNTFNANISIWDVSSVTTMYQMFRGASAFNQHIGGWDTSSVTTMEGMFRSANSFNQDIGAWDVSSVTTMYQMFYYAGNFNQNIGGWDVRSVTSMHRMFMGAAAFNGDISGWDTSQVTNMAYMFQQASVFNQNIGAWDTSKVTRMDYLFYQADAFNKNIGGWDTSLVTDMSFMFHRAASFNEDISAWDTSSVTAMQGMFERASNFNQYIGDWDVSQTTTMKKMFYWAPNFNQPIGGWDVQSVTSMAEMFYYAGQFNQAIGGWDTSQVVEMAQMFRGATSFNQNIGAWDVRQVTSMNNMFNGASVFNQIIGNWDTSSLTTCSDAFLNTAVPCLPNKLAACSNTLDICTTTTTSTTTGTTSTSTGSTTSTSTTTSTTSTTTRTTSTTTTSSSTASTTTTSSSTASTTVTSTQTTTASTTTSTTQTTTATISTTTTGTTTVSTTTTMTSTMTTATTMSTTTTRTMSTTSTRTTMSSTTVITSITTLTTATTATTLWITTSTTSTTATAATIMWTTTSTTSTTATAATTTWTTADNTSTTATSATTMSTVTTASATSTWTATSTISTPAATKTTSRTITTTATTTMSRTTTTTATTTMSSTSISSRTSTTTSSTSSPSTTATVSTSTTTRAPIFDHLIQMMVPTIATREGQPPSVEEVRRAQAAQAKAFIEAAAQETKFAVAEMLANSEAITTSESPMGKVTVAKTEDLEVSDEGYVEVASTFSGVNVGVPLNSLTHDLDLAPGDSLLLVVTEFADEVFDQASSITGVSFAMVVTLTYVATGAPAEVNGLSEPIQFTMPEPYAPGKVCASFDEATGRWSEKGVITPAGQIEGAAMMCETYHLSLFAVMLRGFLAAYVCSNLGIFSEEAMSNLADGSWFLTSAAWFFWIVVALLATIFIVAWRIDIYRSRTYSWSDEFFLVPTLRDIPEQPMAEEEMMDDGELMPPKRWSVRSSLKSDYSGVSRKSVLSAASATGVSCCATCCCASTWYDSAFKEALDEIGANWFAHVSELRAMLEGVWEAMELNTLEARLGRGAFCEVCHMVMAHMVLYSSRRLTAAAMSLDVDVVSFVMDDEDFQEMMIDAREKEKHGNRHFGRHWSIHNESLDAWESLLETVSHEVRLHVVRHRWREFPRMAFSLYTAQNPLGSVLHFSPFMSCKMRAFFVWMEIVSSLFTSTVFYTSQGGTTRRSLDAGTKELVANGTFGDPCATTSKDIRELIGRAVGVSLFSALVASIPLMVLGSIPTRGVRHLDYRGSPAWEKQLRAWMIQDRIIWVVGTMYLGFCHFFIVLFLANLDKNFAKDWIIATGLGVIYHCILIPTGFAVALPLMAATSLGCMSFIARAGRDDLVRGVHELLHRRSNAMLPIMHI